MQHILVGFEPGKSGLRADGLDGRQVTARGLHGLLFNVMGEADQRETDWLHRHGSPKPFSMAPFYGGDHENSRLLGIRLATLNDRATDLMSAAWEQAYRLERSLYLGQQSLRVRAIEHIQGPAFEELANKPAGDTMHLRFLSPTSFKQGPGHLPLPMPGKVFRWPFRVWETFAPPALPLPHDWLTWCEKDVFVVEHHIQTVQSAISPRETFTGFVGEVSFQALSFRRAYLHAWQGLGNLAAFCGIGHKTTMGMGAVELVVGDERN